MSHSPRHQPLVSVAATALLAVACALMMVMAHARPADEQGSPASVADITEGSQRFAVQALAAGPRLLAAQERAERLAH